VETARTAIEERLMSDLEKVELAIQRVVSHLNIQPHETGVEAALRMLANEIATMLEEQRRQEIIRAGN